MGFFQCQLNNVICQITWAAQSPNKSNLHFYVRLRLVNARLHADIMNLLTLKQNKCNEASRPYLNSPRLGFGRGWRDGGRGCGRRGGGWGRRWGSLAARRAAAATATAAVAAARRTVLLLLCCCLLLSLLHDLVYQIKLLSRQPVIVGGLWRARALKQNSLFSHE